MYNGTGNRIPAFLERTTRQEVAIPLILEKDKTMNGLKIGRARTLEKSYAQDGRNQKDVVQNSPIQDIAAPVRR
jgi:hypothetical protein